MTKLPHKKRPCKNCPFKRDTIKGWLGKERITEIVNANSFTCHKHELPRLQCAGHMILLGNRNAFVSTAEFMRINLKLDGRESVFKTVEECIEHHTRSYD